MKSLADKMKANEAALLAKHKTLTSRPEPERPKVELNGHVQRGLACGHADDGEGMELNATEWPKGGEPLMRDGVWLKPRPGTTEKGDGPALTQAQQLIAEECDDIKELLLSKNIRYGNSALQPKRIASKASAEEQILVRIDDKLSRLERGEAAGEDVWLDLVGYIVLLRVCRRMNGAKP